MRTLSDWFGHLTLLELGLAGALGPVLAWALAQPDRAGLREAMAAGFRAFGLVAALALAAGALLVAFAPRLVPVDPGLAADLRLACLMGVAGLLVYPLYPLRILLEAEQRGYAATGYGVAQGLLITALALLFARIGWGITGQFIALTGGLVLFFALVALDAGRRHPALRALHWAEGRGGESARKLWRLNTPTLLTGLAGRVGLLTDNTVVALVLGPAAVAPLFLTQRLIGVAAGQLLNVGNASWAALAELHALGRRDTFNARLLDLTRLVSGLAVAALVPIAAYNHHFVVRWVGTAGFAGDAVSALAAVNGWMLALLSLWGWCFSGTGQVRTLVPSALASAAVNLAASVILTRAIGVAGPLVGTAIGLGGTSLWMVPLYLRRAFGIPVSALARAALGPLAWGAPAALALRWLARTHQPAGWIALGAEMAGGALVLLAVWWRLALTEAERGEFRERWKVMR